MAPKFLAMMLGVRRAGITLAAGILQKAELIQYGSGQITVLDRPGLEAAACQCHRAISNDHDRLIELGVGRR
ncbi:MAG TPA: helix-turn-helix domain-containing protein [Geminicoccus sp.]|uniref:helix-turn-helix domain-containing protein n=1 Tax=Geminicoccus sp. TaxID=2024832 RepID=UPI002E33E8E5|nr:helix-turn-helix domain-containing protein [Geminicoccus sp.]HEX2526938.1 helix-turn-helix domain-containing protein [Geminicoccus sp.]